MTRAKRFEARDFIDAVIGVSEDRCINWPFYVTRKGYGDVNYPGVSGLAHKVVCTLRYGNPKSFEEAAHTCGNRRCVNPNHLIWKTHDDNIKDKESQGTQPKGSEIHSSKLCEKDVYQIRFGKYKTQTQKELSIIFNVHPSTISMIKRFKIWRHVSDSFNYD